MKTKTKTFSLGTIIYRMPNIVESMRLLGKLGSEEGVSQKGKEMMFISTLIDNMSPFIVKIEAIKGDEVITDWETALEHMEFLTPLSEVAGEILAQFSPKSSAPTTAEDAGPNS